MTEYGVQTNNIFDLLNAAEDPSKPAGAAKPKARRKKSQRGKGGAASGQPQGQAAKPAPKKETSQPGAPVKVPAQQRPPSAQPRGTTVTVSGGRGSVAPRAQGGNASSPSAGGGRGNNQGGRGSPNQGAPRPQAPRQHLARGTEEFVRRHDESHVSFDEEKHKPDTSRRIPEHGAKPGPSRGREYDRHPGTGRSPVENKKGGAGQANWGKNDATDELAGTEDAAAELQAETPEAKKEENNKKKKKKKAKKGEEEKEEEKKDEIPDEQLKTFDDFMKEQSSKTVKLTLPPARVAGEGVKIDPKWADAVKREDSEEAFLKTKDEPKEAEEAKKPSKSSLRKKRKKDAKEQQAKKLAEANIVNMFDFSAKKENDFPRGGRGRGRGPREGGRGGDRAPREGGFRGSREGGQRGERPQREGGPRGHREGSGRGGAPRGNQQPRKYTPGAADQGAQFDDSAFPALQVGPPPITVD